MNKKAFEEKMTLLRKYDLAGFSFWQLLSNNDPSINDYLSLLVTNKLPPVKNIEIQPIEKLYIPLYDLLCLYEFAKSKVKNSNGRNNDFFKIFNCQ